MPLSDTEYKQWIITKVGDTGIVAANINTIWTKHDDKPTRDLRYQYALIEAIELLMGDTWQDVKLKLASGAQFDDQQMFANLVEMAERADHVIQRAERKRVASGVRTSRLTTTAPVSSPAYAPDANAFAYGGDPNAVRRGW